MQIGRQPASDYAFPYITARDRERSCSVHVIEQIRPIVSPLRESIGCDRLLDIGCGFGGLSRYLGEWLGISEIHGVDVDSAALAEASEKGLTTVKVDVGSDALPYPSAYFGVVTSFGMLDYLPCFDGAVREIWRVLAPGGYAVVSLPNLASWHNRLLLLLGYQIRDVEVSREILAGCYPYYKQHDQPVGHIHTVTSGGFQELMEHIGFRTVRLAGIRPLYKKHNPLAAAVDRLCTRSPYLARRFFYIGQKR